MTKRERYLGLLLLAALLLSGWLLQQRFHFQQTLRHELVGALIADLTGARNTLAAALETDSRERRGEALGQASSMLGSAALTADRLYVLEAPARRKGRPVHPWHDIGFGTSMLLSRVRALTPDMTDAELRERLSLVSGLEEAIRAGIDGEWSRGWTAWSVNRKRLISSWQGYIISLRLDASGDWSNARFYDPPLNGLVSVRLQPATLTEGQGNLALDIGWDRTYTVWPQSSYSYSYVLIYPAERFEDQAPLSDKPLQDMLGRAGRLEPVSLAGEYRDSIFQVHGSRLPAWEQERVIVLRVLEGLEQQVTLQLTGGSPQPPDLSAIFLERRLGGEVRVTPVALQP